MQTTQTTQSPTPRRWLGPLIKIVLAAGLLGFVLAKGLIDFGRLGQLFTSPGFLCAAVLAYTGQMLLGAARLRRLLQPMGTHFTYFAMLRLNYLGAFFDIAGITSVGGDAVKGFYLAVQTPPGRRTETVSVLLLDRLLGLLGLLTVNLGLCLWQLEALWREASIRPYFIGLVGVSAALLAGTGMMLSQTVHQWPVLQWFFAKMPLGSTFNRAYGSLQKFRDRPGVLLAGLGLSVLVHFCGVLGGYLLARGLGMNVDAALGPFMVALLLSNFIVSFAAFGGIGVGQGAYEEIMRTIAHLSGGANVATAAQIAMVLTKMPGLLAWLAARERGAPAAPAAGTRK